MGSIAKHNAGLKQLGSHMNILGVDVYHSAKYSVDVIFAKAYFTIYFVALSPFSGVDMFSCASSSVTTGGALALAATLVKVKGIVIVMFLIVKIIDFVRITFTTTTTIVIVS